MPASRLLLEFETPEGSGQLLIGVLRSTRSFRVPPAPAPLFLGLGRGFLSLQRPARRRGGGEHPHPAPPAPRLPSPPAASAAAFRSRLPHRLRCPQHPRRPAASPVVAATHAIPSTASASTSRNSPDRVQIQRLGDQACRGKGVAKVSLHAGGFHQRQSQQDRGAGRAVD